MREGYTLKNKGESILYFGRRIILDLHGLVSYPRKSEVWKVEPRETHEEKMKLHKNLCLKPAGQKSGFSLLYIIKNLTQPFTYTQVQIKFIL